MNKITIVERNRRLRIIKRRILKEPHQFQMANIFDTCDSKGIMVKVNCGTAACIAGWAYCLFGFKKFMKPEQARVISNTTSSRTPLAWVTACRSLGLKKKQAYDLFELNSWPWDYRNDFRCATTAKEAACIAAKRIEHFIKTGY